MTSAFRQECVFPATNLAEKTRMFEIAPQRLNQSIGRTYQGGSGNQDMDEGQIAPCLKVAGRQPSYV
jgi:hypothetical protein